MRPSANLPVLHMFSGLTQGNFHWFVTSCVWAISQNMNAVCDNFVSSTNPVSSTFKVKLWSNPLSVFSTCYLKIAPWASCIINGIFWNIAHPRFLTKMDTKTLLSPDMSPNAPEAPGCPRLPHRLLAICDITADPGGSIEFIEECSSIESPFDLYDANHKHQHFMSQRSVLWAQFHFCLMQKILLSNTG